MARAISLLVLSCCAAPRPVEDPSSWFDEGVPYDVTEPVAYTDQPYGLPTEGAGIRGLTSIAPSVTGGLFAAEDVGPAYACTGWQPSSSLPIEVTGVVTVLPQFYFKSFGCGDAEKFYAAYILEDDNAGVLVLNDGRVAPFDAGDLVTMRVRSLSGSFDNTMVYGHTLLDVQRLGQPIRYEETDGPLGADDVGHTRRVLGTTITAPDGFGTFYLEPDGAEEPCVPPADDRTPGSCVLIGLSTEINRRPVAYPAGSRLEVTGPVVSSFGYKILITRLGQIQRLAD